MELGACGDIKNADKIVFDLSDTVIKGNAAYGAYFIAWERLKRGKFSDALGMAVKGTKLYLMSRTKPRNDGMEKEIALLDELYNLMDDYGVTKEELQRATKRYVNLRLFRRKGLEKCLEKMRSYGKPKKAFILTSESVESAQAAKELYNFDGFVCNLTTVNPDKTINGLYCIMKAPEDRPVALERAIGDLKTAVVVSNNNSDMGVFKDKTALNIHFSKKNHGDFSIKDFSDFAKQLDAN